MTEPSETIHPFAKPMHPCQQQQEQHQNNVPMPDISTKDKAQEYIGLDMDAERAAKDNFLKTTAPAWLEKAKANNRLALK